MRKIIVFAIFGMLAQLVVAQDAVEQIRTHYKAVKARIDEMEKGSLDYPFPKYFEVKIKENYPGTGPHEEDVHIYQVVEDGYGEDVIFPPCRIDFVTVGYNFAVRNYYEEYLYDKKGNIELIYAYNPWDEDDMAWEYRFYLNNGKPFKTIVKKCPISDTYINNDEFGKGTNFKEVYNGKGVPKEYKKVYQSYLNSASYYKKLHDAVYNTQHY